MVKPRRIWPVHSWLFFGSILSTKGKTMSKPKFLTNWKTTLAGAIAAGAVILPQVANHMDDDPTTNMDIKIIVGALAVLFGFAASRDGDKSSAGKKV